MTARVHHEIYLVSYAARSRVRGIDIWAKSGYTDILDGSWDIMIVLHEVFNVAKKHSKYIFSAFFSQENVKRYQLQRMLACLKRKF